MSPIQSALIRTPEESFARALGQQPHAQPIDVNLAVVQHRLYAAALDAAGLDVVDLPPAAGLPDACFVQDVALVLPQLSILARPAEPSRRPEVALIEPFLPTDRPRAAIEAPGTLEWGDVLRVENTLYPGLSARTNEAGVEQLRKLVTPMGLAVEPLPVPRGLHLLSGVNYLGRPPDAATDAPGVLLAWEAYAGLPEFVGLDVILVSPDEAPAANCLALGSTVIVPAGYPKTAAAVWHRGFRVLTVPVDEFAKADGGLTCLSILIEE